jgi:hypothetical protein
MNARARLKKHIGVDVASWLKDYFRRHVISNDQPLGGAAFNRRDKVASLLTLTLINDPRLGLSQRGAFWREEK